MQRYCTIVHWEIGKTHKEALSSQKSNKEGKGLHKIQWNKMAKAERRATSTLSEGQVVVQLHMLLTLALHGDKRSNSHTG